MAASRAAGVIVTHASEDAAAWRGWAQELLVRGSDRWAGGPPVTEPSVTRFPDVRRGSGSYVTSWQTVVS